MASNHVVAVLDRKDGKCKELTRMNKITAVSESVDSNLIAIVTEESKVTIFNRTTNVTNTLELIAKKDYELKVTQVAHSFFRKTLIAVVYASTNSSAGTTSNTIALFDTATSYKACRKFENAHGSAPVTAIAFSPFNKYLMATTGADKKVVLHDCERGG